MEFGEELDYSDEEGEKTDASPSKQAESCTQADDDATKTKPDTLVDGAINSPRQSSTKPKSGASSFDFVSKSEKMRDAFGLDTVNEQADTEWDDPNDPYKYCGGPPSPERYGSYERRKSRKKEHKTYRTSRSNPYPASYSKSGLDLEKHLDLELDTYKDRDRPDPQEDTTVRSIVNAITTRKYRK